MSGRQVLVINGHLQALSIRNILVKIDVASLTGYNNFDRGHPVVLILTVVYI